MIPSKSNRREINFVSCVLCWWMDSQSPPADAFYPSLRHNLIMMMWNVAETKSCFNFIWPLTLNYSVSCSSNTRTSWISRIWKKSLKLNKLFSSFSPYLKFKTQSFVMWESASKQHNDDKQFSQFSEWLMRFFCNVETFSLNDKKVSLKRNFSFSLSFQLSLWRC